MSPLLPASSQQRTVAIILCAGQGTRMGALQNKVFLPVHGKPLLVYALAIFANMPEIDEIVLVTHPLEMQYCEIEIVQQYAIAKVETMVSGGSSRHQSEYNALNVLRERIVTGEIGVVMIHDGARPFLAAQDIRQLIVAAQTCGGAVLATPVYADESIVTITEDAMIGNVYQSSTLWRAQTPQAFQAFTLLAAYDQAKDDGFEGTDTASSFERLGRSVQVVPGQGANFKVTTPEDMLRAEQYLNTVR